MNTRRVKEKVSLNEARERLRAFEKKQPGQLWPASMLADVIWPDNEFLNSQGAGAAASRVLKRLGMRWQHAGPRPGCRWGWAISDLND